MEKNIILAGGSPWTDDLDTSCARIKAGTPDLFVTANLEQVLAMIKSGEVSRICILIETCTDTGKEISEKIHTINPQIEVLVWNSTEVPKESELNTSYEEIGDFKGESFWTAFDIFFSKGLRALQENKTKYDHEIRGMIIKPKKVC